MNDKVVVHKYYIPALNLIRIIEFREDVGNYFAGDWKPEPGTDDDDLVRHYVFPEKNEKGEYDPPIDLHDGVSLVGFESGRMVLIVVKGCHDKTGKGTDKKESCVAIRETESVS